MKLWQRIAIDVGVVALVVLFLLAADAWMRLRAREVVGLYHERTIAPLIQRPTQPAPPAK